jgi:hypothetical protein
MKLTNNTLDDNPGILKLSIWIQHPYFINNEVKFDLTSNLYDGLDIIWYKETHDLNFSVVGAKIDFPSEPTIVTIIIFNTMSDVVIFSSYNTVYRTFY